MKYKLDACNMSIEVKECAYNLGLLQEQLYKEVFLYEDKSNLIFIINGLVDIANKLNVIGRGEEAEDEN